MATASLTLSGSRLRFGRTKRTEIRANVARGVLADTKAAYVGDDFDSVAFDAKEVNGLLADR